ncbi:MAG TPA: hypothetical protein VFA11_00690 [Acidimicrobiales bacterium]|nr:hypothetical protein [Acidimicrobiales bacterium]
MVQTFDTRPSSPPDGKAGVPEGVVADLTREFSTLDFGRIAQCVRETSRTFDDARITQFLPILIRREVRARLRRLSTPG